MLKFTILCIAEQDPEIASKGRAAINLSLIAEKLGVSLEEVKHEFPDEQALYYALLEFRRDEVASFSKAVLNETAKVNGLLTADDAIFSMLTAACYVVAMGAPTSNYFRQLYITENFADPDIDHALARGNFFNDGRKLVELTIRTMSDEMGLENAKKAFIQGYHAGGIPGLVMESKVNALASIDPFDRKKINEFTRSESLRTIEAIHYGIQSYKKDIVPFDRDKQLAILTAAWDNHPTPDWPILDSNFRIIGSLSEASK